LIPGRQPEGGLGMAAESVSLGDAILVLPRPSERAILDDLRVALRTVVGIDEGRGSLELAGVHEPDTDAATGSPHEVDAALLTRAQRGDHDAFREIVAAYQARLRILAFHLLRSPEAMNDAVQDTFVKAYVALPEFRGDAALGSWLHRICYRVCLDHLRSARSRPMQTQISSELADPLDLATRMALEDEVAVALGTLSVGQRAVLLLIDHAGYDYASVAEALDVPEGTIASRLSTARRTMRAALRPSADRERSPR
ncbi:MAG TPA: sigma-70 family RNA polymerase sigma factor, partial [Thermoleophilia bacterium]|nr:sigma-70 family RNA polymerase sigma factor [Thermoleophilia bacterium]